jgi:hypothetical protein
VTAQRAAKCRLDENERGAIALITVFMAIFGVAILYTLVGGFQAIAFREGMQDAADTAVLEGAVIHARSMNFIVLVNIVMAALMAILVAVKLMEGLCILGIALAAALAWPTCGASLALVPPLLDAQQTLQDNYDSLKDSVDNVLKVLHTIETTVKTAGPLAADAIVASEIQAGLAKPADAGFVLGGKPSSDSSLDQVPTLPLENDSYSELCDQGGQTLAQVLALPIDQLDPTHLVKGGMLELADAMTGAMEGWFCGESGGGSSAPPKGSRRETLTYPRTTAMDQCETPSEHEDTATERQACEDRTTYEHESAPDGVTGGCGAGAKCGPGEPYETRLASARKECDPATSEDPITFYWYQSRTGRVTYTFDAKKQTWLRGEPAYDPLTANPPHLMELSDPPGASPPPPPPDAGVPPCGREELRPRVVGRYNTSVHPADDSSVVLPVCSNESAQAPSAPPGPRDPSTVSVDFLEITNILGCRKTKTVAISFGEGPPPTSDDDRVPQRVIAGISLGDEGFRVRSLMHGSFGDGSAGRIVRLALDRRAAPVNPLGALEGFGRIAVAEGEYFYGAAEPADAWMWNMKWRARIRRFSVPDAGLSDLVGGLCKAGGSEVCSSTTDLGRMSDVMAH